MPAHAERVSITTSVSPSESSPSWMVCVWKSGYIITTSEPFPRLLLKSNAALLASLVEISGSDASSQKILIPYL